MNEISKKIGFIILFIHLLGCQSLKNTPKQVDSGRASLRREVLTFQTDACPNKAFVFNEDFIRIWLNDSLYIQGDDLINYDTFLITKRSFMKKWGGNYYTFFYSNHKDSVFIRNQNKIPLIQIIDSLRIDHQEMAYLIREYATFDTANSYGNSSEQEYLIHPKYGIIAKRQTSPSVGAWCDVQRLVKISGVDNNGNELIPIYFDFDIPKSWEYDLFRQHR